MPNEETHTSDLAAGASQPRRHETIAAVARYEPAVRSVSQVNIKCFEREEIPVVYRRNVKLIIGSLVFSLALAAASFVPMTGAQGAEVAEGTLRGSVTEAGTGARLRGVSVQAFCWQVVGSDPGAV